MNKTQRCLRDCRLGIKAYQNIVASGQIFQRITALGETDDHLLLSSLFHSAVIRYGKPFVNTDTGDGKKARYKIKYLKESEGFDTKMHDHLIEIRNTLIAHDDFKPLKPRIHTAGTTLTSSGKETFIPRSIEIINKCISHPVDANTIEEMNCHVEGALGGVIVKLENDLALLRQLGIDHPDQADDATAKSEHTEKSKIGPDGLIMVIPDRSKDPKLAPIEPNFSDIHSGFLYETAIYKMNINSTEQIKLPDGADIKIVPLTGQKK